VRQYHLYAPLSDPDLMSLTPVNPLQPNVSVGRIKGNSKGTRESVNRGVGGTKGSNKGTGKASIKSVDEILEGANPGRATKGKATQYEKTGGFDQALDDFNSMGVTDVKDIPGGKVGKLPDGRTVNVRNKSSDGRPTLEFMTVKNQLKFVTKVGVE